MADNAPVTPADLQALTQSPQHHRRWAQIAVISCTVLACALFWYVGRMLNIPARRGYEASLLLQPSFGGKIVALLAGAVLFFVTLFLTDLIAGRFWSYAGLFAAAAGLAAWSARGGSSRFIYFYADTAGVDKSIFLTLLLEQAILLAFIGGVWHWLISALLRASDTPNPSAEEEGKLDWSTRGQGLALQVVLMGLLIMLLSQSDVKGQSIAATFVSAAVATATAEHYFKDQKLNAWWWFAPAVVGLIGYAGNFIVSPENMNIGLLSGTFAPLARAVPLDYAGAGTMGALVGLSLTADESHVASPHRLGGLLAALLNKRSPQAQVPEAASTTV